ncbi:uncharacterized protein [Drosophila tropicalis]|uniref:uncharacterized protein n=1 Tax=Drosophila tropicalis TaxID=46794 RepID=UPI0035ABFE95
MKFLAVFLIALLASCHGAEVAESLAAQERSVSSNIVDGLEALKIVMENGSEKHNIPVVSPLKLEQRQFSFSTGELSANGEVQDFTLEGLSAYDIVVMKTNLILSRIDYELNFPSLNLTTQYKADVGSGYRLEREGGAFLALEDLNISGRISYSLGVISGELSVKSINVYVKVGKVVSEIENLSKYRIFNNKLNQIIEEFITLSINDNTDWLANYINELVTPMCNNLIDGRSLSDILGLLTNL